LAERWLELKRMASKDDLTARTNAVLGNLMKIVVVACCGLAVSVASAKAQVVNEKTYFIPIEIKCPADNKSALELVAQNELGRKQKIVIGYKGNEASYFILYNANPGAGWQRWIDWNYATADFLTTTGADHNRAMTEQFARAFRAGAEQPDKLAFRVCRSGGDERKKALDEITANRRKLGLP